MIQKTSGEKRIKAITVIVRYENATIDEFVRAHSADVSRDGIFVRSATPFALSTLLRFEVRLTGEKVVLSGAARVVWKREPTQATADRPAGMGLSFVKIDESSRALVERVVTENPEAGSLYASERATSEPALFADDALPSASERAAPAPQSVRNGTAPATSGVMKSTISQAPESSPNGAQVVPSAPRVAPPVPRPGVGVAAPESRPSLNVEAQRVPIAAGSAPRLDPSPVVVRDVAQPPSSARIEAPPASSGSLSAPQAPASSRSLAAQQPPASSGSLSSSSLSAHQPPASSRSLSAYEPPPSSRSLSGYQPPASSGSLPGFPATAPTFGLADLEPDPLVALETRSLKRTVRRLFALVTIMFVVLAALAIGGGLFAFKVLGTATPTPTPSTAPSATTGPSTTPATTFAPIAPAESASRAAVDAGVKSGARPTAPQVLPIAPRVGPKPAPATAAPKPAAVPTATEAPKATAAPAAPAAPKPARPADESDTL